jgi:hypothetical protein
MKVPLSVKRMRQSRAHRFADAALSALSLAATLTFVAPSAAWADPPLASLGTIVTSDWALALFMVVGLAMLGWKLRRDIL